MTNKKSRPLNFKYVKANAAGIVNYPDVSNWSIQTYDMAKQHDG